MKIRYKGPIFFLMVLLVCSIASSCSKMNDLHDGYLKEGERVYVGQPDSVKVFPGRDRILLRYWTSDPKAAKLIVYWNARQDSLLLDIPEKLRTEPVEVWVEELEEKSYSFELVTTNANLGNRGIPLEVNTRVYGENFQESLLNRKVQFAIRESINSPLRISWHGAVENSVGINIIYQNNLGAEVNMTIPAEESLTVLPDYKEGLRFRTVFLPEPTAVDEFYTGFRDISQLVEIPISKSTFARWNPLGIPYNDIGSAYDITKLWNGSPDQFFIFNIAAYPFSFTFDMGAQKKLSRFRHWQRLTPSVVYEIQNVKKFELWGSASPNVNTTAGNTSFEGWTKLGSYEVIKPSGAGGVTQADREYAAKGEDFLIDPAASPVRYIRYVVLSTWDNKVHGAVGEMTFYEFARD